MVCMEFQKVMLILAVISTDTPGMHCTASQYFLCLDSYWASMQIPQLDILFFNAHVAAV